MAPIRERVAYLKGLIEGLEISDATKEGKSIKVITEILEEVSDVIKDIVEAQEDMEDYIDSIDNDLSELEDEVYGADFLEIECPYCGGLLEIDANLFDDEDLEIACPECGETIRYDDIDSYLYDEYDEEDDEDEGEDDAPQLKNKGKGKLHPVK